MLCKMDLHQNNQAYLIAYTSTLIAPLQRVKCAGRMSKSGKI